MNTNTLQRLKPTPLRKFPPLGKPHHRPHGRFQFSCTPDNALVIHFRSESPSLKNWGDKAEDKYTTEKGQLLWQREWIDRVLKQIGQWKTHQEYQPQFLPRHDGESLETYETRRKAFESDWIKPLRFPVPIPHQIDKINQVKSGQQIVKPKLYWIPLDGYGMVGHHRETYTRTDLLAARETVTQRLAGLTSPAQPSNPPSLTSPPNFRTLYLQEAKPHDQNPHKAQPDPNSEKAQPDQNSKKAQPDEPNPQKAKSKKNPTFTKGAAKTIRKGGGAIDKLCPMGSIYFITLTCPGSTAAAENTFRENLEILKKRLTDRVLDRMKRNNCTIYSFYAVEIGQRGFKKAHIHWCIASPDWASAKVKALAHSMKDLWFKVLNQISDKTGIDLFERYSSGQKQNQINTWRDNPQKWQWQIDKVNKSVGAYLSKYASKALAYSKRQSNFSNGDSGRNCPLKRWWGMNNKLRQAIKDLSFKSSLMRISQLNPDLQAMLDDLTGSLDVVNAYSTRYMILTEDKNFSIINGQHDIYYVKSDSYLETLELCRQYESVFKELDGVVDLMM